MIRGVIVLGSGICGLLHYRIGWVGGVSVSSCGRRRAKQQGKSNDPCNHGRSSCLALLFPPQAGSFRPKKSLPKRSRLVQIWLES
jgi:hypothetical protein